MVGTVLVVGAGAAGTATAILLAGRGVAVDMVETSVATRGSGITLQGNALRVLRKLGVWPDIEREGYGFSTLGLRAPDGTLLAEFADHRTGGEGLPATAGMKRPVLARLLIDRAREAGVKVRMGTTFTGLEQDEAGVSVRFTDGSDGRYDLVVGADGVRSAVRRSIGIEVEPEPTGMGIWRVVAPRPKSVTRTEIVYGGAAYIAGFCPTSQDSLYAYLVEDAQDRSGLTPAEQVAIMRGLAEHYHGPWDEIREEITDADRLNYTWFETHLIDGPWNRGRVVVIGDAAHSCPPTMAQGAAMALEDAAVLAELLADGVDERMWQAFTARRLERVRQVVDASVQIGRWLLAGERGDLPGLMARVSALVGEPA